MDLSEKIRNRRKELGLTLEEVGDAVGVGKSTVRKWETGDIQNMKRSRISALAEILQISPVELIKSDADNAPIYPTNIIPYHVGKMTPIPVIGSVAAGTTCLAEMDIQCYELIDKDTLNSGYEYVYLRVKGDSMEPLLLQDDLVLIRVQDMVQSGDYAVVIINGDDGVVKKIKIEAECITLISENPYYPPRKFVKQDMNDVRIFGKAVEIKRKL